MGSYHYLNPTGYSMGYKKKEFTTSTTNSYNNIRISACKKQKGSFHELYVYKLEAVNISNKKET